MKFTPLPVRGAFLVELEPAADERGFFARSWCAAEFRAHGLTPGIAQCSISFNRRRGTIRGMHFQIQPHEETKIVRCTAGAIYDVVLDFRRTSQTFGQWVAVELTGSNRKMIYVPEGTAHGFQTLADDTEVFYQMSQTYHAESARGIRWDDPLFSIAWPIENPILSDRDRSFPDCIQ